MTASLRPYALVAGVLALAGAEAADEVIRARYACDQGEKIVVRYFPQKGTAELVRNKKALELRQEVSGSGYIYSNGRTTLRGKGDELSLEIGKRAPISCRAR